MNQKSTQIEKQVIIGLLGINDEIQEDSNQNKIGYGKNENGKLKNSFISKNLPNNDQ